MRARTSQGHGTGRGDTNHPSVGGCNAGPDLARPQHRQVLRWSATLGPLSGTHGVPGPRQATAGKELPQPRGCKAYPDLQEIATQTKPGCVEDQNVLKEWLSKKPTDFVRNGLVFVIGGSYWETFRAKNDEPLHARISKRSPPRRGQNI